MDAILIETYTQTLCYLFHDECLGSFYILGVAESGTISIRA